MDNINVSLKKKKRGKVMEKQIQKKIGRISQKQTGETWNEMTFDTDKKW